MPKKKSNESILEKTEKVIKKVAKEAKEEVEDLVESIKETAEEIVSTEGSEDKIDAKKTIRDKAKIKAGEQTKEIDKDDKKAKLAALKEKAKEFEKAVSDEEAKIKGIKRKMSSDEEKVDTLVPIEDYLKSSIHLGTRVITPDMRAFVYKRRADGLAVFNTALLDEKIREAAEFLSKYATEDIILVCKREAGWKAVDLFSKLTGMQSFTKKYPAGILTNPILSNFREAELVFICDPWIDKNALSEAKLTNKKVLMLADTNNFLHKANYIIPCNNKGSKSLGLVFYLLARGYIEKKKLKIKMPPMYDFTGEDLQEIAANMQAV